MPPAGPKSISTAANKFLLSRLPGAAQLIMEATVSDIKESLSVECPTQYSSGIGSRRHSSPGEPPYRETGRLQDGVAGEVQNNLPEEIDIEITSRRAGTPLVPSYLEFGTPKMAARPYMGPARNRGERKVPEILQHVLGGGL